jgi:hypothetical protein
MWDYVVIIWESYDQIRVNLNFPWANESLRCIGDIFQQGGMFVGPQIARRIASVFWTKPDICG